MAKILYAEDDGAIRSLIKEFLSAVGHEVVDAPSAERANKLFDDSFDIVLSDYAMGRDSGVDLARHIRRSNKTVPIIMLSATNKDEIKRDNADFDDLGIHYVAKGISMNPLNELIKSRTHRYAADAGAVGQGVAD